MKSLTLSTAATIIVLLAFTACARTRAVTDRPVTLSAAPREVPFLQPVTAATSRRELCLVFETPGESDAASKVQAVLITTEGRRERLIPSRVDRRGEALVCLCDERGGAGPVRYRAAELSSETPVRVREIRWWSGEG